MTNPTCWILSDGKVGMESQCLGLVERLGLNSQVKRVFPRFPWTHLPPQLWLFPFSTLESKSDTLSPPWPDILVASGRQTVAISVAIKHASENKTQTIQIQHPRVSLKKFDLVIAPIHDNLTAPNTINMTGAFHRITDTRLNLAAQKFYREYSILPKPLIAVLLGGSNNSFQMTRKNCQKLIELLKTAVKLSGGGIVVTPSRRTDQANLEIFRSGLSGVPHKIWNGLGENPYFGILALADGFVVTNDSVNMVTEAASTTKPVYIFNLDGHSSKFDCFHKMLVERGIKRKFDGIFENWHHEKVDNLDQIASKIKSRLKLAC